ncbi:MAG: tetratricopeptide repeat protein [Planctomycetales bacterium]|nr:tetratricopeptide repeat protein [Planctomycetales bacterium]
MIGPRISPHQAMSGRRWPRIASVAVMWAGALLSTSCTAQLPDEETKAVTLLNKAGRLLEQKRWQEAAEMALQAEQLQRESYQVQQAAGQILYLSGHSQQSLACFDRAVRIDPVRAPDNWQRGIALASCGKFVESAAQFKTHHDVNPDDVENSAWYFLCIAKTQGIEAARKTVIPSRGDSREPMMSILRMLKGEITPQAVLDTVADVERSGPRARFYADLYVGLYFDSLDQPDEAIRFLKRSLQHGSEGYMVDTARVYLNDRFAEAKADEQKSEKPDNRNSD